MAHSVGQIHKKRGPIYAFVSVQLTWKLGFMNITTLYNHNKSLGNCNLLIILKDRVEELGSPCREL